MRQHKSPFKWCHEAAHMMGEGQVKRLDGKDASGQAKFVAGLFGVAA